jgi:hypothetical protein
MASGKANRLFGKSREFIAAVLALCILPGVAVAIYWRDDLLLLSLYLAAWTSFTLYSLPPIRLKTRGVLGLLADASGAHLFPTLLAVSLVYRWRGEPIDPIWFASVAVWSLTFGLRGILWHQLSDLDNDEKIGLRTFARRHKIARVQALASFVFFPLELSAFAVMLWRADSRLAVALLCFYGLLEFSRKKWWQTNLVIAMPKPRSHIVMQEYYEVFFPAAILLSSSSRYPIDAILVAAHLAIFPRRAIRSLKNLVNGTSDGRRRRRFF